MYKILIIEEQFKWRKHIHPVLKQPFLPSYWPDGKNFQAKLKEQNFDLILLDMEPVRKNGFQRLEQIKKVSPYTPVIVVSKKEEAGLIVKAVKAGAFDFVKVPFSGEKIRVVMERALENRHLKNEIDYLRREQDVIYDLDRIIAESPSMKDVMTKIRKYAKTDATILITGETGTGKSFLSGAVHFNSKRRTKSFIKINCANLPEALLESELFGHEKGSFTGATKTRVGRLEQGRDGTVFLDEIGEMSLALQAKLLRFLEDKSFDRIGGSKTIFSDVRIIAATNRDLEELVAEGKFRDDLFYRLNVLRLHLPPLRERKECIELLANFFLDKNCRNLKKNINGFASPRIMANFKEYSWPGNIRQLANTIERAVILEESDKIGGENIYLPEPIRLNYSSESGNESDLNPLRGQEKEMIIRALEESDWIQKDAAKLLGISPRVLNYKVKIFGITHKNWRKNK